MKFCGGVSAWFGLLQCYVALRKAMLQKRTFVSVLQDHCNVGCTVPRHRWTNQVTVEVGVSHNWLLPRRTTVKCPQEWMCVCVCAAGKPTGQLRQAQYVRSFFYFDRVCVRPPFFFSFEVFCFVYFFKVLADIVCVSMRRRAGLANNFQDAWCARTVFRLCVCFILFGLFTLLGTVFEWKGLRLEHF